jgi:hypothetical protein
MCLPFVLRLISGIYLKGIFMSTTYANKAEESATSGFSLGTAIFFCFFWVLLFIPALIYKSIKRKKQESADTPSSEKKAVNVDASPVAEHSTTVRYQGFDMPEVSKLSSIHFLGDYDRVFLRLYPESGVITRSVRTVILDAEGNFTSKETKFLLENFTTESAEIMEIEFSLASALDFTCKELSKEVRIPPPVVKASPEPEPIVVSEPIAQGETLNKASTKQVASEGSGVVVRAGKVKVERGTKSYETFEVSLRDQKGEFVEFSGVDLEEKFASEAFKVGDVVRIIRGKPEAISKEKDGKKSSFSKNLFSVVVIQSK